MTDDRNRPWPRGKPSNPEREDTLHAPVDRREEASVGETLPQAPKAPPGLEDLAVDATLPVVRRAPPGVEQAAVDATLPAVPKEPPRPGDLGVASTLPVGTTPARLANVGLKVALSKGVVSMGAPVDAPAAPPAPTLDEQDALRQTLEVYAPAEVQDPLAKLLGVPDGLVNPDGAAAANTDAAAVAEAEYAERYELRDEVGHGGIGRVVLAFDPRLGREVALKELLPRFASGKSVGAGTTPSAGSSRNPAEVRFLDEARITAQLEHPGIVPVYELGQRADGGIYYAMRMVRGRELSKTLAGRDLPARLELLPNYLELCHAMAYAHSRGVVHRDLKPDNVMLGEFGETVVLDWGLAKVRGKKDRRMEALADEMELLRQSSGTETVMGAPLGTPAYMPPEQAAGQLERIDARSDVYSLGAILYEVLTGRPPHMGTSALEVLEKVGRDSVVPPEQRDPAVPPELAAICMRALARRPEDRYESAQLLAEDVRRFQVGGLVRAHDYTLWDLTRRWLRRHRKAMAVVTALLAVAAGMWWYRGYADARRRARAEQQRQSRVRAEVEQVLTAVARGPEVKNWLDVYTFKLIALREPLVERRLVRALGHPQGAVRRLVARSLGGMKSRRAVKALCARLAEGVEPSETVIVAVINALGIIGDSRANDPVSRARFRLGQHGAVWRNTELAFRMIPLPPLPRTGVTANLLVDRGRDTALKGDRAGALALFDRAIAMDPKLTRAYVNRAVERRVLGDAKGALADYGRAIVLDPGDPRAYHNRAAILRQQRKYAAALRDLDRVVASAKYRAIGLQARARVYQALGRVDDALRDYGAAFRLSPGRALIPYHMAFLWAEKGDLSQALASLERALKIQPSYCRALTVRAAIRQHRGDLAGAVLDAERAVAVDPAYEYAYTRRGQVQLDRGRQAAARADFDTAIALARKRAWRWGARGAFYFYRLGQYDEAARDFGQALERARSEESAHRYRILLAAALVRSGDRAGAKRRLTSGVVARARGSHGSLILWLRGEIDGAAARRAVPLTPYRRAYLDFVRGLKAELDGDVAAARAAYVAVLTPFRWSTLWFALAQRNVKVLGQGASPKGPGSRPPMRNAPLRVAPMRPTPPHRP